jgi:hypothetical protein
MSILYRSILYRLCILASDEPIDARPHRVQRVQSHAMAAGLLEEQYLFDPRRKGFGTLNRSWDRASNLLSGENLPTRQTMPALGKLWFSALVNG